MRRKEGRKEEVVRDLNLDLLCCEVLVKEVEQRHDEVRTRIILSKSQWLLLLLLLKAHCVRLSSIWW